MGEIFAPNQILKTSSFHIQSLTLIIIEMVSFIKLFLTHRVLHLCKESSIQRGIFRSQVHNSVLTPMQNIKKTINYIMAITSSNH